MGLDRAGQDRKGRRNLGAYRLPFLPFFLHIYRMMVKQTPHRKEFTYGMVDGIYLDGLIDCLFLGWMACVNILSSSDFLDFWGGIFLLFFYDLMI